jgi:hypothetical protein
MGLLRRSLLLSAPAIITASKTAMPQWGVGFGASAPAPAQAAGYNLRTWGPNVSIGAASNWVSVSGLGWTNNANGSVTLGTSGTPIGYNGDFQSIGPLGAGGSYSGTAFGGGGYFQMFCSWPANSPDTGNGWPAWWTLDVENWSGAGGSATNTAACLWPGTTSNYIWFEPDIMEWFGTLFGGTLADPPGSNIHNWFKAGSIGAADGDAIAIAPGILDTVPGGWSPSQIHSYSMLWVPATPTVNGILRFYLDDSFVMANVSYPFVSSFAPYPPSTFTQSQVLIDSRHLFLLMGTGLNNPMTVYSTSVWQRSRANNIVQ